MATRFLKRHDTGDVIAFDATNIPDAVASQTFTMTKVGSTTPTVNKAAATFTANDGESGRVSYELTGTDTATAGRYRGEFELTLDDGNIVTYPADSFIDIWIKEDLA